jgi:hypothetical protein
MLPELWTLTCQRRQIAASIPAIRQDGIGVVSAREHIFGGRQAHSISARYPHGKKLIQISDNDDRKIPFFNHWPVA